MCSVREAEEAEGVLERLEPRIHFEFSLARRKPRKPRITLSSRTPQGALEEKPAALVLHYRGAPQHQVACGRIMAALAEDASGFTVRHSKMALELMPERICKRDAVEMLLDRWTGDRTPVAIGDDRPDEGMFGAVQERGGFGIRVGDEETCASYRIRSVADVHALLDCWLQEPEGASCRVG